MGPIAHAYHDASLHDHCWDLTAAIGIHWPLAMSTAMARTFIRINFRFRAAKPEAALLPMKIYTFLDEFYLLLEQRSEFWPKFRNSGSMFLCRDETSHTTCYTRRLPKHFLFSLIEMSFSSENWNCCQFHDIMLMY